MWVWVVVIVALIGAVAVVAVGRGDAMADVYDDRPDTTIATGRPLTADDLRDVRFTTAVRGYRMDEVDSLLARLQADLLAREPVDPPVAAADPAEPADPAQPEGPGGQADVVVEPADRTDHADEGGHGPTTSGSRL